MRYCYNLLGVQRFYVGSDREIPAGTHQVRMEFDYDGPGMGKGGTVTLYLDGEKVGEGAVGATAAMIFSADDTCDVGKEGGALVAEDYPVPNDFTGEVNWVEIDVGAAAEDADHVLDPDELLRWRWRGSDVRHGIGALTGKRRSSAPPWGRVGGHPADQAARPPSLQANVARVPAADARTGRRAVVWTRDASRSLRTAMKGPPRCRPGVASSEEASTRRPFVACSHADHGSRRRLDVCLIDDAGEVVEHTATPPDATGCATALEPFAGSRCGR